MKALEKDRTRRYETAVELAADLRRHLDNEPVMASPPSTLYRMKKFVRRHTVGVAFAAVVVALLSVLAVTMTIQAGRIAQERDRANRAGGAGGRGGRDRAAGVRFPGGSVRGVGSQSGQGQPVTAREILDQGAERIQNELDRSNRRFRPR